MCWEKEKLIGSAMFEDKAKCPLSWHYIEIELGASLHFLLRLGGVWWGGG